MSWLSLFNPMNWFKLAGVIASLLDLINRAIEQYKESKKKAKQEKEKQELKDAVKQAQDAKTVQEKADAACRIEKSLDPDSTCDVEPRS